MSYGKCRRFQNEELHSRYRSPNITSLIKSKRLRWRGHVARTEGDRSAFKILKSNPIGRRLMGRPRLRWIIHVARMEEVKSVFKNLNR